MERCGYLRDQSKRYPEHGGLPCLCDSCCGTYGIAGDLGGRQVRLPNLEPHPSVEGAEERRPGLRVSGAVDTCRAQGATWECTTRVRRRPMRAFNSSAWNGTAHTAGATSDARLLGA